MLIELFGKSMSKLALYIGPFTYPDGGAAARRISGNLNALRDSGYEVEVIDGQEKNSVVLHNNINVISLAERPRNDDSLFRKVYKYLMIGRTTLKYIENMDVKPNKIIIYSGYSPYLLRLLPFCKKNNIAVFFDCVEWYEPKNKLEYLFKPYYWNIELAMRYLIPKCSGVISISSFLDKYYLAKGCRSLFIPPTVDTSLLCKIKNVDESFTRDKIKLVYSGSPGAHKDNLDKIIEVVCKHHDKFELHIAGISSTSNANIFYHGYLAHSDSLKLVAKSHFSVLLRPDNKVSKAGFSTKVVESLSLGTPVVANDTGDLSQYIINGKTGYIFDGLGLELTLLKLFDEYNIDKYKAMTKHCLNLSEQNFDYRNYSKNLSDFMSK